MKESAMTTNDIKEKEAIESIGFKLMKRKSKGSVNIRRKRFAS